MKFLYLLSCLCLMLFVRMECFGQVRQMELINKKTNQWIAFMMSSNGKSCYNKFRLVTKTATVCNEKPIIVSYEKTDNFIDSLKRNGWTGIIKYKSGNSKYKPEIELKAIHFQEISNKGDSVFQFVYKITLIDIKSIISQFQLDTVRGTEKGKVINAFAKKKYKFDDVKIQKGTSIIKVGMDSDGLINIRKNDVYVFYPWTCYYF